MTITMQPIGFSMNSMLGQVVCCIVIFSMNICKIQWKMERIKPYGHI